MDASLLDNRDIFIGKTFSSCHAFYDFITDHLLFEQKIKDGYKQSILHREEKFPTGLDTGLIKVAIPHTDYNQSNTTQLVITTLSQPVKFRQMDKPSKEIAVSIILLILFDKPQKQLTLLQQIMKIVQNQQILTEIMAQKTTNSMVRLFKKIGG
ncbi:MAG: PTS sugar transporter subunit IIA [Sporolactobacillus sp.]|jgi:PTS system galactitol-specific IIA component|nr:PTS sugar transporter subunit IIA [Sporolactobacillus sp.]